MKRIIFGVMVTLLAIVPIHSGLPEVKDKCADTHSEWLWKNMMEMRTIQVGMTRRQLMAVFEHEGGLSTRKSRTYVYRKCDIIKVTFEFKPVGNLNSHDESMDDEIINFSKPFLQSPVVD